MKKNTLSVIMCNYNYGQYIKEALEAILTQSYQPKEVIVVDDGSTDDSVKIIERLAEKYSSLVFIKNEKNMGSLFSVNLALSKTTGDYIYSASSDDKILPGFFEKTMNLLNEYPEAVFCCSDPVFFDDESNKIKVKSWGITDKSSFFPPEKIVEHLRRRNFLIAGHTLILKKKTLLDAGGYIPELKWHVDWFMHHVFAFRSGICYIPEGLAMLRQHRASFSSAGKRGKQQLNVLRFMLDLFKTSSYSDVENDFKRSKILSVFGLPLLRLMFLDHKYFEYFNLRMVRFVIRDIIK